VLCSATLDAAILPAGSPRYGPHQAAHHRARWEQLLLAGRHEETMEVAPGGEGGWPTLKSSLKNPPTPAKMGQPPIP
jgi:hypothetical protein